MNNVCITHYKNWTILSDKTTVTFVDGTNDEETSICFKKTGNKYNTIEYWFMNEVFPEWMEIRI